MCAFEHIVWDIKRVIICFLLYLMIGLLGGLSLIKYRYYELTSHKFSDALKALFYNLLKTLDLLFLV